MQARNLRRTGALLAALACCSLAVVHAGSDRTCELTDGASCPSPYGCYNAYWPAWNPPASSDGYCWHEESDLHGTIKVKFPSTEAPGTARMHCEPTSNCRWSCVAAPYDTGLGFTYNWSTTRQLHWDPQPQAHENYASVLQQNTHGGLVTVEVVSPSGTASSVSLGIPPGYCVPF